MADDVSKTALHFAARTSPAPLSAAASHRGLPCSGRAKARKVPSAGPEGTFAE